MEGRNWLDLAGKIVGGHGTLFRDGWSCSGSKRRDRGLIESGAEVTMNNAAVSRIISQLNSDFFFFSNIEINGKLLKYSPIKNLAILD